MQLHPRLERERKKNRSATSRQAPWEGGWEGRDFLATNCHTVYRLFMNKICVSLGHCCGPVTMASVVRGRGMWPYWATKRGKREALKRDLCLALL